MLQNLKALVVVLGLALIVFALAKPLVQRFMSPEVFVRRRNVWLALTVVAFVSPSFWFYALVAFPTLFWLARKDPNPLAVYVLMLHVVPSMSIEIPTVFINQLFDLSNFRILAFAVLLPVSVALIFTPDRMQWKRYWIFDLLVIGYAALQLVLFVPYESFTNTMRRGFLYSIDVLLIYVVFSRLAIDKKKVTDTMASMVLAASIMAAVGVFESIRSWLLYVKINEIWGDPNLFSWILRGDSVRAQGPAGHSIVLGYVLAIAMASWLHLQRSFDSFAIRVAVHSLLWAGMLAAASRGAWVAAAVAYLVFYLLVPYGTGRQPLRFSILAVVLGVAAITPFGSQVIDRLPFIGTEDTGSVLYRQQLAESSWELIKQNPVFGSPFVLQQLESLRQGQGIIDLVNSYAAITMFYGVVGLMLFLGTYLMALQGCLRLALIARRTDAEGDSLAALMSACMVATLVMLATVSIVHAVPIFYWMLAGVGTAFAVRLRWFKLDAPTDSIRVRVATR